MKQFKNREEIQEYLLSLSISAIFSLCEDLIEESQARTQERPIVLTPEEYERITSLFRVKGSKEVNGELVAERRGRPRKDQ